MHVMQLIVDALSLGSQYGLVALGIGLVFGVMRMINFAHGDLVTFGAYALVVPTAAELAPPLIGSWPAWIFIPAILAVVTAVMLLTERFAFRPLRKRGADGTSLLISSFAVSYLLQSIILFVHTGRPKSVNILSDLTQTVSFFGVRVARIDLVTIITTAILLSAVVFFLNRTRAGREVRAASEDFSMARLLGVRADKVIAYAFAVSGILAAVVSLLYVTKTGTLDYRMGVPLAIAGFVGTVVGGMGSLTGAVLGGFSLGIASTLLQALLPAEFRPARDAFLYGAVIFVLLMKPEGIFTSTRRKERV